jgi:DNA-binding CsgD family transcriptional regulator
VQPSADDQGADIAPLAQAFALTGSEAVVLASLVEALTPKEIAERLSISSHTVRAHMRAIYAKLGVRARSGVMKAALRLAS